MKYWMGVLAAFFLMMTLSVSAPLAVTWDADTKPDPSGGSDYAAGIKAFEREDWREVIERMGRAVKSQPWLDEAFNRMGFAFRKIGNYEKALENYGKALKLNPYHRGALEYLGETYLEMGMRAKAVETLSRLEGVCRRTVKSANENWRVTCEEWRDLNQAIQTHQK